MSFRTISGRFFEIPLCHPLSIDGITLDFYYVDFGIRVEAKVRTSGKTGVAWSCNAW